MHCLECQEPLRWVQLQQPRTLHTVTIAGREVFIRRNAGEKLRLRQAEILELVDASERLYIITAYRVGGGLGQITREGDYQIQYLLEQEGLAAPTP